jgi:hypothetical protein
MRLIFVHGRDQQGKERQALQRVWTEALDVGLDAAGLPGIREHEVVFPYYADDLIAMVKEIRAAPAPGVNAKGGASRDAGLDSVQIELLQEMLGQDAVAAVAQEEALQKGVQNTAAALALARLADRSAFGPGLLTKVTEDVSIYLQHQVVAQRVNALVAPAIGTQPCVVVAHSLGSIVAYRVLRELGAAAQVRRFITVGSPLGLHTVRKLLSPPARTSPAGVRSWFNAFDPADIVALHPLDEAAWPVSPAITNHPSVKNHMGNHHGISGYLDDPTVARAIYDALNAP